MPLRSIETKEQRQQRFLERDLERERRKQGLSSLPGQAAWMAGLMAPTSGITDYFGLYPEAPTGKGITGETMPSFGENIQDKRYLDAFYQGLGITGDLVMGAGAFYPPLMPLAAGMKVASGVGKASKAAKGALHSRYKTAPYHSGDNIVTNPDVLNLDLPKEYGTTIQAKYAETADGKFIISPDKMESTFSEFVKDMRPLSINEAESFGKNTAGKPEFDSLEEARTALIDYVLRDEGWFGKGWDKTEQKHLTKVYDWLRKERGMTVRPPETGIIDEYNAFIPFTKMKRGEKTQYQKNIEEDPQGILEVDLGGGHSIKGTQEEIENFFAKEPFDPEEQRLMDEAFERYEKKKEQESLDLIREETAPTTIKVVSGMGKTARTAKQKDMARQILPRYFVDEAGGVPNADVLRLKLPKSHNTTIEASYVERTDGKIIMAPKITTPSGSTHLALDPAGSFIYRDLDQAKTGLINFALADDSLKLGHPTRSEAREKTLSSLRKNLESERNASVLPHETGIIDENFDFIPFTEKPLLDTEQSLKGVLPKMTRERIDEMWAENAKQDLPRINERMDRLEAKRRGITEAEVAKERIAANVPFEIPTPQKIDVFAKADQLGAKADELLDWQKPLTEQQPVVQEKIKNLIGEDFFNQAVGDGYTGEEFYDRFNDAISRGAIDIPGPGNPAVSKKKFGVDVYLNDAGIKGIAYGPDSVKTFDPKKTKIPKTAQLPKSLQTPKKPIGAEEVAEWNRRVENQERTIDLLESGGYTPKGMTEEEVDIALKKIFADQETVEVEVFDFLDDDIPEFNSGGPVTKPLYANRRYL